MSQSRQTAVQSLIATALTPAADAASGITPNRDTDERWKHLILRGNKAFTAHKLEEALNIYLEALVEAEQLLHLATGPAPPTGSHPVPALVISATNAANVWKEQGEFSKAETILNTALIILRQTLKDDHAPSSLRTACLEYAPRAMTELIQHMRRNGAGNHDISRMAAEVKTDVEYCLNALAAKRLS